MECSHPAGVSWQLRELTEQKSLALRENHDGDVGYSQSYDFQGHLRPYHAAPKFFRKAAEAPSASGGLGVCTPGRKWKGGWPWSDILPAAVGLWPHKRPEAAPRPLHPWFCARAGRKLIRISLLQDRQPFVTS